MRLSGVLFLIWGAVSLGGQTVAPSTSRLEYIVYLSRHGVRTPLTSNAALGDLSVDPWPAWGIPLGYLTAHGRWLMQLMGAYNRDYLLDAGLLSPKGCIDAEHFYVWADTAQRDIESARALAWGILPECSIPIHSLRPGLSDAIFAPAAVSSVAAGIKKLDRTIAAAAVGGRIGDNPRSLYSPYPTEVDLLQRILLACDSSGPCPKDGRTPKRMLLADVPQPAAPAEPRDHLADLTALSGQINTLSEAFFLEYTDGMDMKNVGWGRVDLPGIRRLMTMRSAAINISQRTPFTAKAHASNMLSRILRSMEQATSGQSLPGSLGHPGDKVLMILGHDGDMVPLSAVFNISWIAEGYPPNDTPPGSSLVFEIWRDGNSGRRSVRTYLLTETPEKMRAAVPLSLKNPPTRTPVFLPACSAPVRDYPCDWDAFRKAAGDAIDPDYVAKEPPGADTVR